VQCGAEKLGTVAIGREVRGAPWVVFLRTVRGGTPCFGCRFPAPFGGGWYPSIRTCHKAVRSSGGLAGRSAEQGQACEGPPGEELCRSPLSYPTSASGLPGPRQRAAQSRTPRRYRELLDGGSRARRNFLPLRQRCERAAVKAAPG